MKRQNLISLIIILLLSVIAIAINLSQPYLININTSVIPVINHKISYKWDFKGLNPETYLKPLGINRDLQFKKGLDLQGGTSVTLIADMKGVTKDQREDALNSAKTVIEKRINFFGVSEPVVQTSKSGGEYRIIAEIPAFAFQAP